MTEQRVAVLGSTGSIGTQTLEVCGLLGIRVEVLCAGRNIDLLEAQARRCRPSLVSVADTEAGNILKTRLADMPCRVVAGPEAAEEAAAFPDADVVVTAMTGTAGLLPTMAAVRGGKRIALANKETLVCAGRLVMDEAARHGAEIVPVDSEHSAIFQSMDNRAGVRPVGIKHPNWSMGAKVTIDSATMMNKGLELIEAMHLFGMAPEDIEILVHPQSIVHSAVEYADGAVIAQLGTPDMRLPIQYALTWPERLPCPAPRLDLAKLGTLTFEKPDLGTFRCLRLAMETAGRGMSACCAMNAANEIAVSRYLKGELTFGGIYETAASVTEQLAGTPADTLEEVLALDAEARRLASGQGTRQQQ